MKTTDKARELLQETEEGARVFTNKLQRLTVSGLALAWSLFQLATAQLILLDSLVIRSIHLAFALGLVYLCFPAKKSGLSKISPKKGMGVLDPLLAIAAIVASLYVIFDPEGISLRQGAPHSTDLAFGIALLILLLEGTRRALGPTLPIVVLIFTVYSFNADASLLPDVLQYKAVSLNKFISKMTMWTEGVYGVPLNVSANIVFLFVLFGAFLDKAGAGEYFVKLAYSLLGGFKGGPAKAAVLASGMTGMVSGSSIANTVTTGTFTIPLMRRVGYPAHKAGAIEVACSTNGQLMPPIMGAAAFIIAENCNLPYIEVIKAAFIPAIASYIALIYITHLEASKLGLSGVPRAELPRFRETFVRGIHFWIPIAVLLFELAVLRHSPNLAVFRAILIFLPLIPLQMWIHKRNGEDLHVWHATGKIILDALISGAKNMMGIGVAVASAGIIVGIVTFGLGGIITEAIDALAGGSFLLILLFTAVASLLLGMGLPTTANYIVMASLTAPVIVTLGAAQEVVFPLIAAHLFVFFFGVLADDTPPVGLAAYAAAAIAKSNPIKTGIQGFKYDIRTAILPLMFIFNTDLLLHNVSSPLKAAWIFICTLFAMFSFAALTQNWLHKQNRWWESLLLASAVLVLLRPDAASTYLPLSAEILQVLFISVFGLLYIYQKKYRSPEKEPA